MAFPLYDDNPFKRARLPFVTWGLIALNVIIFIMQTGMPDEGRALLASFGATPQAILTQVHQPGAPPPYVTLVTSMFLHGGWEHLLGNMIYLFVFGDDIEDALGWSRFLLFYLLAGIAATVGYVAINPHSTTPLVGASGAISGILAAYLMLRPCAKVSAILLHLVVRIRAFWVIGGWILFQLFQLTHESQDGVAYVAHAGGLLAGALLFLLLKPSGVELFECVDSDRPEQVAST
jgi:membrane associated rhomboid family serine protease